ncbi:hypothetical protein Nepgr_017802 [Nepenthes gracilis]|uniref:Transcription repressor n=1 Tax=Nepenthes gracilis TaxID=150966 RepID=A0AAD3XTP3_NEPGR|nr:hypothetical protein Nepgr_017802 [Nepenthes gracilis]
MPRNLQKSIAEYLSKIKKQTPHLHISPSSLSSTTSRIFSGCRHPKSLSFTVKRSRRLRHRHDEDGEKHDHHQTDDAATLADIDRFLFENFKSLYSRDGDSYTDEVDNNGDEKDDAEEKPPDSGILFDSPRFLNPPPDLSGSHRFFVSSGLSGSLMEEARTSGDSVFTSISVPKTAAITQTNDGMQDITLPGQDCIAVLTPSPNPYDDFRRSMKEVIEARVRQNQSIDWDFIEELLFCYLRLNEKQQYKYILGAFVDLITILRQNSNSEAKEESRDK